LKSFLYNFKCGLHCVSVALEFMLSESPFVGHFILIVSFNTQTLVLPLTVLPHLVKPLDSLIKLLRGLVDPVKL